MKFKVGDSVLVKGEKGIVTNIVEGNEFPLKVKRADGSYFLYKDSELQAVEMPKAPLKLELGKRYVRRDGHTTGPLVCISNKLFPFKDPHYGATYSPEGTNMTDNQSHETDLVAEYVEPASKIPKEPTPGKWYAVESAKHMFIGLGINNDYVYQTEGGWAWTSKTPYTEEWKEPVVLPAKEVKRWLVVLSKDTDYDLKRGVVLASASSREDALTVIQRSFHVDEVEIVEVTGTLPAREVEG